MNTTKTIYCPACGNKMLKVNLPNVGFTIDICTEGCGGILFDNRELEIVCKSEEISEKIIQYLDNNSFKCPDTKQVRICPVCNTNMVKTGGATGLEIDVCNSCGSVFLDSNELKRLKSKK